MHMRIYKIAAINLGSTSTKIAYYENENCVFKDNIVHTARALEGFSTIWEQFEFRKQAIEAYLKEKGILISGLDAVVTRGGHTEPIVGGVYRITRKMLEQSASEKYGNHATDLGFQLRVPRHLPWIRLLRMSLSLWPATADCPRLSAAAVSMC